MSWGKMDDKFHRNRKVRALREMGRDGVLAIGVWTFWWSWCLDDPELTGIVPRSELSKTDLKAASKLVEVGLWEEVSGGFLFHDFHFYNPTKSQVEAKREYDRKYVSLKRLEKSDDVVNDISNQGPDLSSTNRVPRASRPVPSQPIPLTDPDPPNPPAPVGRKRPEREDLGWAKGLYRDALKSVGNPEPDTPNQPLKALVSWAKRWATSDGCTPEAAVSLALQGFLADDYARRASFRLSLLAKNAGSYAFSAKNPARNAKGPAPPAPHTAFKTTDLREVFPEAFEVVAQ